MQPYNLTIVAHIDRFTTLRYTVPHHHHDLHLWCNTLLSCNSEHFINVHSPHETHGSTTSTVLEQRHMQVHCYISSVDTVDHSKHAYQLIMTSDKPSYTARITEVTDLKQHIKHLHTFFHSCKPLNRNPTGYKGAKLEHSPCQSPVSVSTEKWA